jgi:hypothetical protein
VGCKTTENITIMNWVGVSAESEGELKIGGYVGVSVAIIA